ncbi:MAG: hypothetical protein ACPLW8_06880, partial [Candidatus Bathyarchaeales archaeon]
HYEALENIKQSLPSDIMPRGINLPEGVMREIRRVKPELQPKILQTAIKNELTARETAELVKILTVPKFELKEPKRMPSKDEKEEKVTDATKKHEKYDETLSKVLAKYYPVDFVDEVLKRFGDQQLSFDKVFENIVTVLGVAWSKIVELDLVDEVFREAEAWH